MLSPTLTQTPSNFRLMAPYDMIQRALGLPGLVDKGPGPSRHKGAQVFQFPRNAAIHACRGPKSFSSRGMPLFMFTGDASFSVLMKCFCFCFQRTQVFQIPRNAAVCIYRGTDISAFMKSCCLCLHGAHGFQLPWNATVYDASLSDHLTMQPGSIVILHDLR